jgi:hypothetical protein
VSATVKNSSPRVFPRSGAQEKLCLTLFADVCYGLEYRYSSRKVEMYTGSAFWEGREQR